MSGSLSIEALIADLRTQKDRAESADRAKSLLREKQPFVWNSTHLSAQMRKKTLDLLYAYVSL